ncbi:MAG: DNA polymerase III subunit delta [Pseudomonadota bacterium]|nr:DNA polymerase III subunit delta [Pseudomonadota bacterium]
MATSDERWICSPVKISAAKAGGFLLAPPNDISAILIYGPDLGLVRERAETATKAVSGTLSDPFNVVELTPAVLRDDPARLTDEACTLSMTGGRRVIRLRDTTDVVAGAIKDAIAANVSALIIVEAGELSPRSKLRGLFEKPLGVAAIPCYADEGAALESLVRETLAHRGLSAEPVVVSWITSNLGADRMVTRMELEKMALYAMGQSTVSLKDAQDIIGDTAAITIDDVVVAAAGGDLKNLILSLARARFEGITAITILRATSRHLFRLEEACAEITLGVPADQVMKNLRPPVFFRQRRDFLKQLTKWRQKSLNRARNELIQAEMECKSGRGPEAAVCERVLMRVAAMAGAKVPH